MADSSDKRDDLVTDVADALTRNQEIEWERCAILATPDNRRALGNLRALAGAFRDRIAAGAEAPAAGDPLYGSVFVRRATQAIIAIAAVQVAAALILLPWAWDDYHREHGEVAVFLVTMLFGHGVNAGLLLIAGRRERRTWLLGGYFLLKATHAPQLMLPAFLLEMPPPPMLATYLLEMPPATKLFLSLYLPSFLFAPAFLWAFARECPRVQRKTRLDDLALRMVPVSVAIGCAVWATCAVSVLLAQAGHAAVPLSLVFDGSFALMQLLALAAVVVVVLRAHTAPAAEVRRVMLFGAGFLLYIGLAAAYDVAEVFSPGYWIVNFQWSPGILAIGLMRSPGPVLLWYSVLAVRVPHVREVVRACSRWLLMHSEPLWVAAVLSAAALGWMVASRPERAVGAVLADPLAQALFGATGIVLLLALGRRQMLSRLDAWVYPETGEQRYTVASAATALAKAGSIKTVTRTVTRAVKRGCGSGAVLLVATDPKKHADAYHPPDARVRPLERTSAIIHMLETVGRTLRVHRDDKTSLFALLPDEEAAWVVETDTDAIVPVPGPGGELLGVLVVGRRFDDRIVRIIDLPFLEALAAAAGLAIGRLRLLRSRDTGSPETGPAEECSVCGYVKAAGEPTGCNCESAYVEAEVPKLLTGKFRLTRRLGSGGMGAAYLARDLRLERNVAVKTLTRVSHVGQMGLKPEAWAMVEVTHPAVAQIYGIESWQGRPFLVVEYLAGGTLADRLGRGPVPGPEAISMTAVLADALAAVHDADYLHRDIKPGNIGFTSGGSPKLLDFGLAHEPNDDAIAGGTLRYLSPEILSGRPAEEADDVWSLCVVLYEMVSGRHPFAGGSIDEVTERIRRQNIGGRDLSAEDSGPAASVTEFAASVLSAPRSARPATARGFADMLRELASYEK